MIDYSKTAPTCEISVLGTIYKIWLDVPENEDAFLMTCNGYCDKTAKRIVVVGERAENELDDWSAFRKVCLRHEIIHAFMYESGLDSNTTWCTEDEEHPEMVVEWIAVQFPKMLKTFNEVGAL